MENLKLISLREPERHELDKASMAKKDLHLSVEVRENRLLACLLDKETSQYLSWASFNRGEEKEDDKRSLESILKEEMLNTKCSSSSVVFTQNGAMLIPASFFLKESVKEYLMPQNLIKQGETPGSDFIKNNDCYSVYAVNTADYSILKEKFPQAAFRHHSSVFVEYLLALYKGNNRREVHVFVFNGYMDIVALQPGKLLLYNRYTFQTPNDFTYFVLWVYEQLKLKPEDSPCFFYGEITEKSELFIMSWRYLKNVRLADRITRFAFSNMLENLATYRYYSLFMQYMCI
jgi:Protein of unknown function (DUF3822)